MRKLIFLCAFAGFLLPFATLAQSNHDGTWKVDTNQVHDAKPLVILIRDGMLEQDESFTGLPIKIDGEFHPVSGDPAFDKVALKIVDPRHLEINNQKDGKLVSTVQVELSADGNTTTETFSELTTPPGSGKVVFDRVAPAPPGSELFSGSWRAVKFEQMPDNSLTLTFKTEGDSVHITSSSGLSYSGKLDGTEAPFHGNPSITTATFKRTGPNTYELTEKFGNDVYAVVYYTVSADGKTLTDEVHVIRTDSTIKYVAVKQ